MINPSDKSILRGLAEQYRQISDDSIQMPRRRAWSRLNSLLDHKPLIYVRAFAAKERADCRLVTKDPLARRMEQFFRYQLAWYGLGDDSIFEPYITLPAVFAHAGWGYDVKLTRVDVDGGSFKADYPITDLNDLSGFVDPVHKINEEKTLQMFEAANDAVGDILPVVIDRTPFYTMWHGDIATDLGYLRGMENFMLDIMDTPDELKRLCERMGHGVLSVHEQAEAAGDWSLLSHRNQAMPYAEELPWPAIDKPVKRKQLWGFMAAQEFALISPEHHDEFLLQYQLPILKEFGLVAYGCCEDLTRKIDMLKQIPNLRRISVSPFANVEKCAEASGGKYVLSFRPRPAHLVGDNWKEVARNDLQQGIETLKGTSFDITLKDVETLEGDQNRAKEWVQLARETIAAYC